MGGGTPRLHARPRLALNGADAACSPPSCAARRVLVNSVCPGWVATDMGGRGGRPVAEGAAGIVWAATLPDDGPTGGFSRDGRPLELVTPSDADRAIQRGAGSQLAPRKAFKDQNTTL